MWLCSSAWISSALGLAMYELESYYIHTNNQVTIKKMCIESI